MKQSSKIVALIILVVFLAVPSFTAQDAKKTVTTASGLKYVDVVVGKGASPTAGKQVTVHYTGTLENTAESLTVLLTAKSHSLSLSVSARLSQDGMLVSRRHESRRQAQADYPSQSRLWHTGSRRSYPPECHPAV